MGNIGKVLALATAAVGGYFVGFYEMKYKTMKSILITVLSKEVDEPDTDDKATDEKV